MFDKRSRHADHRPFIGDGHFRGIRPRAIGPAEGIIEHVITAGERLDQLALHYYKDAQLWWRILDANPELLDAGELSLDDWAGRVIAIPRAEEPRA